MVSQQLRAIALRVAYHIQQKLPDLHGQPTRTLVMMVSAFIVAGGPWLSEMGRKLANWPGFLQEKVKRMSRFLCKSEFDVQEAFRSVGHKIMETMAHAYPRRTIDVALDWTDLGEFMGLWLSLPYQGRALPLACVVLPKENLLEAMTDTELELIRGFLSPLPGEIRSRIAILADRGFAKLELFQAIEALQAHWVIRLPRHRHIRQSNRWIQLQDIPMAPGATCLMGQVECIQEKPTRMYLAIRRLTAQEHDPKDDDDTWYVASDLAEGQDLLDRYSRRFQIEEMFRDLKGRLNIDRHRLGTEESVSKMMLIAALAYLVILEDGTQWRSRVELARIQKTTAWGKLSVYSIAFSCFELCLPDVPEDIAHIVVGRWFNRQAA